ncbi:MAG: TolC family protein [Saprospirales bacterium]|nr:TolC family protein [Saprospirales bacterium]MBK8493178.1 TolC family protein [Saprospirales bacterium]
MWILTVCAGMAQGDSTILTYREFIGFVWQQHPLARQAELQMDFADAALLSARGAFDPVLSSGWNEKYFDDKHYYRIFDAGFRIPTWYGLSVTGGYENTDGTYLNPENKTDQNGLWTLGVEANLLQGLLIDERRAALQQAKVYQQAAENERKIMLNELLFAASQAFLNWQAVYNTQGIIRESIQLAEEYLEATKQLHINGAKPAIDTLEAFLIVQDRLSRLQTNQVEFVKAKQQIENFLWFDQIPLELQETTQPAGIVENDFEAQVPPSLDQLILNHPEILEKEYKKTQYEIDQRLKRDKLKPKLKLKYNSLLATPDDGIAPNFYLSNYKWGFNFSMPILLRSERAAIENTGLKIREVEFSILDKQNSLKNKIEGNLESQLFLEAQVALQQQNVGNYGLLLEAERERFSYGESSVFLLNKREEKYLETRVKLVELTAKLQQAKLEYLFVTGTILDSIVGMDAND